jgi:hypothetical protein
LQPFSHSKSKAKKTKKPVLSDDYDSPDISLNDDSINFDFADQQEDFQPGNRAPKGPTLPPRVKDPLYPLQSSKEYLECVPLGVNIYP